MRHLLCLPKILILSLFVLCFAGCQKSADNINVEKIDLENKQLLYVQDQQIYLADELGKNAVNISHNNKNNFAPLWLKKGEQVLYYAQANNYFEIIKQDLNTQETTMLASSKQQPHEIVLSQDRKWLVYKEDSGCYLLDLEDINTQRFSLACSNIDFSTAKKFVYQEDDKIYLLEFSLDKKILAPKELLSDFVSQPIFLNNQTILFQKKNDTADQETYDLYTFSLADNSQARITNLNLPLPSNNNLINLDGGKKIIYQLFYEDYNETYLVTLSELNIAKKILENTSQLTQDNDNQYFYYVQEESLANNEETVHNIYRLSLDGINKESLINNALQPSFYTTQKYDIF